MYKYSVTTVPTNIIRMNMNHGSISRRQSIVTKKKYKNLVNQMREKLSVATDTCINQTSFMNKNIAHECTIMWDQIDELSNAIDRIEDKINEETMTFICDDIDDEIENRLYDV